MYICYIAYVYMLYIHIHCVYALYIYHSLFTHSPKGHLGCCHFWAIRNRVTVNTGVQGLVGVYIFTFLGQISLSEIAGLYGKCTFNSEKPPNCFAQRLSCRAVSLAVCESSQGAASLSALGGASVVFSCSDRCVVLSH